MRRVVFAFCSLSIACNATLKSSRSPANLLNAVQAAEARRDGQAQALKDASAAQQRSLRIAALKALSRIEALGTSSIAISVLGDPDQEIAEWAAFAVGQIGESVGQDALRDSVSSLSSVPTKVLLALGRTGTASTAEVIAQHLDDPRPKVQGAAALALGLLAKRQPPKASFENRELYVKKIVRLIRHEDRDVRFGAVYGLSRMPGPRTAIALIWALADKDAEIRANAARGLGAAKAAPQVFDRVIADPDWRVRVEVVRALGQIGSSVREEAPAAQVRLAALISKEFDRFLSGGSKASGVALHVLLQIAQVAPKFGPTGKRLINALEQAPWSTMKLAPEMGPDLARLQCAVAYALDRADGVIRRVRSCGGETVPVWRKTELITRLLAEAKNDEAIRELVNLAGHQDPKVRAAATLALGDIKQEGSGTALLELMRSNDPYIVSAAAEILARPDRVALRPAGVLASTRAALKRLIKQPDASLIVLILDALGALGTKSERALLDELAALDQDPRPAVRRRAALARARILNRPIPYSAGPKDHQDTRPAPIERRVKLLMKTPRGDVTIELFGDVAPRATGAIVSLAQAGFYRGLNFHRVVSDFVVQGGCPRGDGWGGPGYTIDGEISPLPFVRGAVGIATNGRDTGGSQFFIMHSHHPHLEGGYSLIGRVLSGMEAVDALQQDDAILDVVLLDGPKPTTSVR